MKLEFKEGDRVRIIELPHDANGFCINMGDTGFIRRVLQHGVYVIFDEDKQKLSGRTNTGWWVAHQEVDYIIMRLPEDEP